MHCARPLRRQWPGHQDLEHNGHCAETYNIWARAPRPSYRLPVHQGLEHGGRAPRRRTQWPVHQDFAHTGPCTKAQNRVAAHQDLEHSGHCAETYNIWASASRPSYRLPVHQCLEHGGSCTENTVARARRVGLQNGQFGEFKNSRIQEFQNPKFRDS